jgi:hypothetical protein
MAIVNRAVLESFFIKGAKPSELQFKTLIESMLNLPDDSELLGLSNYNPIFIYVTGNTVVNNNGIYQANKQTTAGPFNANDWNLIAGGTPGYLIYKGLWDAQNNIPDLTKITKNQGDFYVVSVKGNTNLDGITDWQVNDWAIFNGTVWQKIDNSGLVTDAENIAGPGAGVYKGKNGTVLQFKPFTNIDGSININNGSDSIDLSVQFNDTSVSPSNSWSSFKINSELNSKEPANPNIQAHIADMNNPHNVTKAQVGLSNVDNTSDINKPVSTAQAAADAVVLLSANTYADSLVVGFLDDRGNYDASGNVFPSSGGSGISGAILKGNLWTISVPGTLGGNAVTVGDVVRALTDSPGQINSNWAVTQNNLGYVAENSANKDTDSTMAANSDVKYPSQKAVKTALATKEPTITGTGNITDFWSGAKTFIDFATTARAVVLTGLSLATNQVISATDTIIQAFGYLQKQISDNLTTLTSHIGNTSNPHNVTKGQVGLSNVDNTSDINKPVSTAQAAADAAVLSSANAYSDSLVV